MSEFGYDYPYQYVRDIFLAGDLAVGNLECAITDRSNAANKPQKFLFKTDAQNVLSMKNAGITCLSLANNHAMDYKGAGLRDTIGALERDEIGYFGAGLNENKIAPYIFEKNGIKIGFLGYSAVPPEGFTYNKNRPTVKYVNATSINNIEEDISKLKDSDTACDFVVVYLHMGVEYADYVSKYQKIVARAVVDYDADLVIGAHPHVLQEAELYAGKFIYYSLGNFIFDTQPHIGTDETIILQAVFKKGEEPKYESVPIKIIKCQPTVTNPPTTEPSTWAATQVESWKEFWARV